ncbi:MAG: hypothetical protein ACP5LF_03965 [Nitrososphaeria archaeon]|nr:hypothetical protein [Conexivisphaerales archaeon]
MIDKDKLASVIKSLGGYEDKKHNIYVVWTVECKDPIKYVFGFRSDAINTADELLKFLPIRTKRERAIIIDDEGVIIDNKKIKWAELNSNLKDEFLKKILILAEKS